MKVDFYIFSRLSPEVVSRGSPLLPSSSVRSRSPSEHRRLSTIGSCDDPSSPDGEKEEEKEEEEKKEEKKSSPTTSPTR